MVNEEEMTTGKSDIIDIYCDVLLETEKAILVENGNNKVWLPKSMVEFEDDTVTLPEWLAIDKGLI